MVVMGMGVDHGYPIFLAAGTVVVMLLVFVGGNRR